MGVVMALPSLTLTVMGSQVSNEFRSVPRFRDGNNGVKFSLSISLEFVVMTLHVTWHNNGAELHMQFHLIKRVKYFEIKNALDALFVVNYNHELSV